MNESLQLSVEHLKGVGPETKKQLEEMNIHKINDLLEYFPYRYEDYRLKNLEEIKHEEKVTVEGKVHSEPSLIFYGRKKSRLTIKLLVEQYLITVVFFNQPYLKSKLAVQELITVTGKWDQHRQTITANHLQIGSNQKGHLFEPVYAVKGNMTVKIYVNIYPLL